ncbi:transcriptional regulator [Microbispora sp. GKU 823]|uniref:transcriptional regulator n=1 Tax=Microbispora sp. GKU 823 TaxID=1652100 RepID=UPI0021191F4F|nr:transcriptional regulator [Microbispora sp. GKU 823]
MTSDDLESISVLGDPVRRALYRFVAEQGRDVGRNEAAEATGVQRTLAAHHLDKLVEAGLLEAGFRRLSGRAGPGGGRPAKVYRRVREERAVSLPPRDYRTLALVLAETVDLLGGEEKAEEAARRAGEAPGRRRRRVRRPHGGAACARLRAVRGGRAGAAAQLSLPCAGRQSSAARVLDEPRAVRGTARRSGGDGGRRDARPETGGVLCGLPAF